MHKEFGMISMDFLRKAKDLKKLNEEQLRAIQSCCKQKEFRKGDRLFRQGETALHVWVLTQGEISLRFDVPEQILHDSYSLMMEEDTQAANAPKDRTSEKNTISVITKGMSFGWSSFVPPYKYSLSAYCETDVCELIRAERDDLINVFEEDPQIGYVIMSHFVKVVGQRFYKLQSEVVKRKEDAAMFKW